MITVEQAALVLGMLARGDKQHDIAAHFGENSGRIIDIKARRGKYADVVAAPPEQLPPRYRAPVHPLIDAAMSVAEQVQVLDELIQTTPLGSPSVVLEFQPDLARVVLETRNRNNRNVRPGKIRQFVDALTNDCWMLTGDTIKFGINGELLDGQNRLRACLTSGVSLRTHVVFGIDPDAFTVLDSGAKRTMGDTFKVAKVPNAPLAAKAVRWIIIAANAKIDRGLTINNADLFDHYQKRVNKAVLQEQMNRARKVNHTIPHGLLAGLLYLFVRRDAAKAALLAHDLEKEVRYGKLLVERIKSLRAQNGGRLNERNIVNLLVMTWNAYRTETAIGSRTLRWTDAEPDVEIS
jgi:hypothetical protein